jgi:hypothetical protein
MIQSVFLYFNFLNVFFTVLLFFRYLNIINFQLCLLYKLLDLVLTQGLPILFNCNLFLFLHHLHPCMMSAKQSRFQWNKTFCVKVFICKSLHSLVGCLVYFPLLVTYCTSWFASITNSDSSLLCTFSPQILDWISKELFNNIVVFF